MKQTTQNMNKQQDKTTNQNKKHQNCRKDFVGEGQLQQAKQKANTQTKITLFLVWGFFSPRPLLYCLWLFLWTQTTPENAIEINMSVNLHRPQDGPKY